MDPPGPIDKRMFGELVFNWRAARSRRQRKTALSTSNEITVIDKSGEEVLSMMITKERSWWQAGLSTKHLLEALHTRTANPPIDSFT